MDNRVSGVLAIRGAVVQGRRATTVRTRGVSCDAHVVALGPAASTGLHARGDTRAFWCMADSEMRNLRSQSVSSGGDPDPRAGTRRSTERSADDEAGLVDSGGPEIGHKEPSPARHCPQPTASHESPLKNPKIWMEDGKQRSNITSWSDCLI